MVPIRGSPFFMFSCAWLYFGIGYNVYCGILFSSVCPQSIYTYYPVSSSPYHSTWCIQAPVFAWSFSDEVISLGPLCILVRSVQSTKDAQVLQGLSIFAGSAVFHHRLQPIIIFWDVDFQRLFFSATIELIGMVVLKQSLLILVWLFDTNHREGADILRVSLNLVWCADF